MKVSYGNFLWKWYYNCSLNKLENNVYLYNVYLNLMIYLEYKVEIEKNVRSLDLFRWIVFGYLFL